MKNVIYRIDLQRTWYQFRKKYWPIRKNENLRFTCNICEASCKMLLSALQREAISCQRCGSTVRMRAIIHALAMELFGKSLTLPMFPANKALSGIGMSDWDRYALILAQKFNYQNTFYDSSPRLDIKQIDLSLHNNFDFVISSDVFEHVLPPIQDAFVNVAKILKPTGVLIFSAPYSNIGETIEHFPELHDFEVINADGRVRIINRTIDGRVQVFHDPIFNAGSGFVLEIRRFAKNSLLEEMHRAGFQSLKVHTEPILKYGIIWLEDWSLPITARLAKQGEK